MKLSDFAGRVTEELRADAASRAQRVSRLAEAVRSGSYGVDAKAVSQALVDQALAWGVSRRRA